MKDYVKVADNLRLMVLKGASKEEVASFLAEQSKDRVTVTGFMSLLCRERGKVVPGTKREGHNIWTLTGSEHITQLMSYKTYGPPEEAQRTDRIRLIGFGIGSQPESSSVESLVSPIAYDASNNFLAQLSIPTYPLSPSRTAVRYSRTFSETELSVSSTVTLTEAGLFTDGDPAQDHAPGTRDETLANAVLQAPNAYKVFEPISKTQSFVLEVSWEIRI